MGYHRSLDGFLSGLSARMNGFWIFILEGALALALAVFIVWWTLPKRKDKDPKD